MGGEELEALAAQLVRERIRGTRKGTSDDAQHEHCFRVAERLRRHSYAGDVVLAGLLHDIVEDGETTLGELTALGFSDRTLRLVDLATHDRADPHKDRRWARMVERLRAAADRDAWALKICDLIDNLNGCATMPNEERRRFFLEVKAPVFLRLTYPMFGQTALFAELLEAFTAHALSRFTALSARSA